MRMNAAAVRRNEHTKDKAPGGEEGQGNGKLTEKNCHAGRYGIKSAGADLTCQVP